jgi:hypothetical protein
MTKEDTSVHGGVYQVWTVRTLHETWKETDRIANMCSLWCGGSGDRKRQLKAEKYPQLIVRMCIHDSVNDVVKERKGRGGG